MNSPTVCRNSPAAAIPRLLFKVVQWGLLVSLMASLFGRDVFRLGDQTEWFGIDLVLRCVRGILLVFGSYLVYPLLIVGLVLFAGRGRGQWLCSRLVASWRLWLLLGYLAVEVALTDAPEAARMRLVSFTTCVLPTLVACLGLDWLCPRSLIHRAVVIFAVVNLLTLAAFSQWTHYPMLPVSVSEEDRLVVESDAISTAVNFFIFALAGLVAALSQDSTKYLRFAGLGVLIGSVFVALCTGSRGPVFAFLIAAILFGTLSRGGIFLKLWYTLVPLTVLGFALVALPLLLPKASERISTLPLNTSPGRLAPGYSASDTSTRERFEFYGSVLGSEPTAFGRGIGAFGDYAHRANEYVHNLFLEAYFETGIVGLCLVVWVIFAGLQSMLHLYKSSGHIGDLFCFLVLVFYLVEAQFSTTLLANRGLLPFLYLAFHPKFVAANWRSRLIPKPIGFSARTA